MSMNYREVSPNVILKIVKTGSNIACLALENELVFVDTGLVTEEAIEFRREMEQKFEKKATKLILTHGHIDHFFAMDAFSDCELIAAEGARPKLERFIDLEFTEERVERFAQVFPAMREAVKTAKLHMPDRWISENFSIGEKRELEIQVLGGHSSCSTSIFYVPDKIMLVGDLIQADVYPYFGEPDTDIHGWINSLKKWEEMDIAYILPGHGEVLKKEYSTKVRIYFEKLISCLREFRKEKLTEEQILARPELDEGYWPKGAERKPAYNFSITNLYKKIEG